MAGVEQHFHPVLVHLPVAFFLGAALMEILSRMMKREAFHQTAIHLYVIATLASTVTVLTGWLEAQSLHLHHPILEKHETLGFITLGTSLFSLPLLWFFYRKNQKFFRVLFLMFVLMTAMSVSAGAYLGGELVYTYGVGIKGNR